ncbi:MAG TPA: substrate-binding domain-containing protein [Anaerolineales bacterium]|nr:substrate-binding domain-containing protein [Anaerolineales bacterium]
MNKPKHLFNILAVMLLLVPLLAGCGGQGVQSEDEGIITISGAFALYPLMVRWGEEYSNLHPGVQFDISAGGAGKGMTDALSGAVEIGMVSRDISPEEEANGAFWVEVVKDAVFPTISSQNPVYADLMARGISKEIFVGIFISGEITTWGQVVGRPEITDAIHVYTRSDSCGAAEVWAKFLDNNKQENLLGIGVSADPGLLDAVVKDPLGIGYNNLNYAFDPSTGLPVAGAGVVPVDANGDGMADASELLETKDEAIDAVATGLYPSPPARALNLVTLGKPSGLVLSFLEWILADGQQYINEVGYIPLTAEQIQASQNKLR